MSKCVSVERVHDDVNPLLNSVEFIWGTTTVAVGDTAVLHCSFDAIFQQLRTGSVSFNHQFVCRCRNVEANIIFVKNVVK